MRSSLAALAVLLAACDAGQVADGIGGATTSAVSSDASSSPTTAVASSSASVAPCTDAPSANDCPDDAKNYVYLVAAQGAVFRFSPATLAVEMIGLFDGSCGQGASPFAMAVDAGGRGWVDFATNVSPVQHVDLDTATCSPSCVEAGGQSSGIFALAFVGDGAGGESLYLAPPPEQASFLELRKVDITNGQETSVGYADIAPQGVDLTGTSDGRLFAFVNTSSTTPPLLVELDPQTGAVKSKATLPMPPISGGWAIAFYGGSFYLFTDAPDSFGSKIDRWDPATETLTPVLQNLGFDVTGAGTSTCVPLTPPG